VWYIYCNNGGRGETLYCAIVISAGGDGVGRGTYTKGGCAKNSIDSCTKTQTQNNILYRLRWAKRCNGAGLLNAQRSANPSFAHRRLLSRGGDGGPREDAAKQADAFFHPPPLTPAPCHLRGVSCRCEKPPPCEPACGAERRAWGPSPSALASTHRTHTHTLARTVHLTSIPNRRARRAAADRVFKKRDLYFCIGIGLTPLTHFASVAVLRSQCIRVPITVITLHRPVLSLRWWSSRQWVSLLPS